MTETANAGIATTERRQLRATWKDNTLTCWYGSHSGMRVSLEKDCVYKATLG